MVSGDFSGKKEIKNPLRVLAKANNFIRVTWGIPGKQYGKEISMQQKTDQGSASLEAAFVVPIFLLAMVTLFLIVQSVLVEAQIYEAAAETAEYMSELAYMDGGNDAIAYLRFPKYVDDTDRVNQYVKQGVHGITFSGSTMNTDSCYVQLRVAYDMKYMGARSFEIKKRAYTGADWQKKGAEENTAEKYVYVTDNQEVYHLTRQCSYLSLQIQPCSLEMAKNGGYDACAFCGTEKTGTNVYITSEGERYHSSIKCSGLKRTIYRKKKSEVQGLGPCSRCGGTE